MNTKTLEAITGTDYVVVVSRDEDGDYEVEVRKTSDTSDPYVEYETVAVRFLEGNSSEYELNRLVREIIELDRPSLVGVYAHSEDTEESNGNE